MSSRLVRQLTSWIALLAILAVTFMPTITQAMSGSFGVEVCSASKVDGTAPAPAQGHHVLDHCPYCALHADLALPVLPPAGDAPVAVLFRELPAAFLAAPRASTTWSTAQSRAPPRLI